MKSSISEFSYAYAVTDELVHWLSAPITAAPIFPSLIQEGRTGGGYDVNLNMPGYPLFLQFKRSDRMVRRTATEIADYGLPINIPFFRFALPSPTQTRQHALLLALYDSVNGVFYMAPRFSTPDELTDAYFSHEVLSNSIWIPPRAIPPLGNDPHDISFDDSGSVWFLSDPIKIENSYLFPDLVDHLATSLANDNQPLEAMLVPLYDSLTSILQQQFGLSDIAFRDPPQSLGPSHQQLGRVANLAMFYFDTQMFIVQKR